MTIGVCYGHTYSFFFLITIKNNKNMSLDVYLGRKMYLSYDKGVTYEEKNDELFWANITHNLGKMADKAGIYEALWRPYYLHPDCPKEFSSHDEEYAFEVAHPMLAKDIIQIVEKGYEDMKARPEYFKQFDSPNGWGLYIHFLPWVEKYLEACKTYPDAEISVSR